MSSIEKPEQETLLSVYNELGLNLKPLMSVGVPVQTLNQAKTKYQLFEKNAKENYHTYIPQKLNSIFKKKIFVEDKTKETGRRKKLNEAFQKVYPYMEQLKDYFSGCSNVAEIEKYCNRIRNIHKKLEKKGYVDSLETLKKDGAKFSSPEYMPDYQPPKPIVRAKAANGMSYEQQCKLLSSDMHQMFISMLNEMNEVYTSKYKEIEKVIGNANSKLEKCKYELNEALRQYDLNFYRTKRIVEENKKYFKKGGNRRVVEQHFKKIAENRIKLSKIVSEAKRVRFNAVFSYLQDQKAYNSLTDEIQIAGEWINTLDQCLEDGDTLKINEICEGFNKVIVKLDGEVEKFKNSKINAFSELDSQISLLEKYMTSTNEIVTELKKLNDQFGSAYKGYCEALQSKLPLDISNLVMAIVATVFPMAGPLYQLVDKIASKHMDLFDEADSYMPKVK